MSVVVRPVEEVEISRLIVFLDKAQLEQGENTLSGWTQQEIKRGRYKDYLIAEVDGRWVGSIVFKYTAGQGFLQDLFVFKDSRRKKIGTQILKAVDEKAKQLGLKKLFFDTDDKELLPFYKKYGYSLAKIEAIFPGGRDIYSMEKNL